MARIENYMKHLSLKIRKDERSLKLARRIAENLKDTMDISDEELRTLAFIRSGRINGVTPINGKESSDPVYRKISLALSSTRDPKSSYWGVAGMIQDYVTGLQIKMEERTMTEREYNHINGSSINGLLEEWNAEIQAKYLPKRKSS